VFHQGEEKCKNWLGMRGQRGGIKKAKLDISFSTRVSAREIKKSGDELDWTYTTQSSTSRSERGSGKLKKTVGKGTGRF